MAEVVIKDDNTNYCVVISKYDGEKLVGEITIDSYGSLEELMDELQKQFEKQGWNQYDKWQGDQE